jgi:hypothetical protein
MKTFGSVPVISIDDVFQFPSRPDLHVKHDNYTNDDVQLWMDLGLDFQSANLLRVYLQSNEQGWDRLIGSILNRFKTKLIACVLPQSEHVDQATLVATAVLTYVQETDISSADRRRRIQRIMRPFKASSNSSSF